MTVPVVPTSISTAGIAVLDAWATRAAEGAAAGSWQPGFLAANARHLPAAAEAASFLACQSFLELYLEVQLLRVALMEDAELWAAGAGPRSVPPVSSLRDEDFAKLPCLLAPEPPQPAEGPQPQEQQQRQDQGQQRPAELPGQPAQQSAGPTSAPGAEGAADGALEPARGGWGDWSRGIWNWMRPAQRQAQAQARALQPRRCSPQQLERLVASLLAGNMLRVIGARADDVRDVLHRLGFCPTLSASRQDPISVRDGRVAYVRLPLGDAAGPEGGDGVPGDVPGISAAYEVEAVTVQVDSHDQGWSSFPQDRETTNNSWTWGELLLTGPDCRGVRAGSPPRLYTNLHAVRRVQSHRVTLQRDSEVVQDMNRWVFAPEAVAAEACAPGGSSAGHATDTVEGGSAAAPAVGGGSAAPPRQPGGRGYQLVLLVAAMFPGWEHFVQRAEVVVHLRPRSGSRA